MITLKESILRSTKAGRSSFTLDQVLKGYTKKFFVYSTEYGWEEYGGDVSKFLNDKCLDCKHILNHFWSLISSPKERLNKVFTHILNNKNLDTNDDFYIWKQEDVNKLNTHFNQIGFSVSFLSVSELKKFSNLNKYQLESYLKIENDNWIGVICFPRAINYRRFKNITQRMYWELKEDFNALKKSWDKTTEYMTEIRFE
jgi:hypothetical protein